MTKGLNNIRELVNNLSDRDFLNDFIYDYDVEGLAKKWRATELQIAIFDILTHHQKVRIMAPREHLKTTTILDYLVKRLLTREYPLEITYFHLLDELAGEKFNKLKRLIETNPLLNYALKMNSSSWSNEYIELSDGSIIRPISYKSSTTGRHPHITILDDTIDNRVIYSDLLNKKAIDKFYSEIYPMVSKNEKDKQIIIIGTTQRKDDLYHSLPPDFNLFKWSAYRKDGNPLSPELFTVEDLKRIESNISAKFGNRYWLKEYMNVPLEALGYIVKPDDIRYYSRLPQMEDPKTKEKKDIDLEIYQGWDLSVGKNIEKGDWSVCVTIGIDRTTDKIKIYVLDVYRARIDFSTRIEMVGVKFKEWKPINIGIESNNFQFDLVKVCKDKGYPVTEVKSTKNKVESFTAELAPYFENGQVFIKEFMSDLKLELLSLPVGEFDDQADALKFAIKVGVYNVSDFKPFVLSF